MVLIWQLHKSENSAGKKKIPLLYFYEEDLLILLPLISHNSTAHLRYSNTGSLWNTKLNKLLILKTMISNGEKMA